MPRSPDRRRTLLRRTLIGCGVVLALALAWSGWFLFGPLGNGISVGPETTHLTGPLDSLGYVDYDAAVADDGRVPPEENAAVALFRVTQARLRREMAAEAYVSACGNLGVSTEPDPAIQLLLEEDMPARLRSRSPDLTDVDSFTGLIEAPWPAEQEPEFAAAVIQNAAGLAVVADGLKRLGYWFWPEYEGGVIHRLLPLTHPRRLIARQFGLRAMMRIGEGDLVGAAEDVDSLRQLATRPADLLITQLQVSRETEKLAFIVERTLLDSSESTDFIRRRRRAVDSWDVLRFNQKVAAAYDRHDRFMALELVQGLDRYRHGEPLPILALLPPTPDVPPAERIVLRNLDLTSASRRLNDLFEAASVAFEGETAAAVGELPDVFGGNPPEPGPLWHFDPRLQELRIVSICSSSAEWLATHVYRVWTRRDLLRVLAAGRLFELERGRPPASVDDLAPAYLLEWPTDHHDGQPLRSIHDGNAWPVYGTDGSGDEDGPLDKLSIRFGITSTPE